MRAGSAFGTVWVCVDYIGELMSVYARRSFRLGMRTWLWFHGNSAVQIRFGRHAEARHTVL
jgi:hypothetical protein